MRIQVAAFIPAEIGRAFGDWEHPTGLANQDSFDAEVDGQPGTWFEEPMSVGNPFSGASQWYVGTDNRGFGGNTGQARIYTEGSIDPSTLRMCAPGDTPVELGSGGPGIKFASQTAGSERIRTNVDGLLERDGTVESQFAMASVSHGECWSFPSSSLAVCDLHVQGSYPFAPQFAAPDIDYALTIQFERSETGTTMSIEGSHNGFPAYEVLVNGTPIWQYMPSADGPGLWNLGFQYVQITPYTATL